MATTPSIAMIPSGYKDEKVYSVLPTNGDGDFTFARTSTATRVNNNGLIEEVGINKPRLDYSDGACPSLLLEPTSTNKIKYSEAFGGSYWTKSNSTVQGDPSTAGTEEVTNGDFATDTDWTKGIGVTITGGKAVFVSSTLNDPSLYQSSVLSINKTYKVTFEVLNYSSGEVAAWSGGDQNSGDNGTFNSNGIKTVYVTTTVASNGILIFGSSSVAGNFDIDNVSVKEVQGFASPSGDTSAFKLVEGASNGEHFIQATGLNITDDKYSFTLFAKAGGNSKLRVRGANYFDNTTAADFDLTAKTATNLSSGANAKIVEMSNGWFKCTFTSLNNGDVGGSGHFRIYLLDDNGDVSWLGDGTSGVYIFGAQLEEQSYATSYIKNEGTAAGITRAADTANGSGDATVINSTEGVLYFESSALANDVGSTRVLSISDGTGSNTLYTGYSSASNVIQAQLLVGGVAQTDMIHTVTDRTDFIKVAILYQNNNHKMFVNGVEVATDIVGLVPSANTFNKLNFDLGQSSFDFYGKVKDLRVYTTALSDAELTTLTTI